MLFLHAPFCPNLKVLRKELYSKLVRHPAFSAKAFDCMGFHSEPNLLLSQTVYFGLAEIHPHTDSHIALRLAGFSSLANMMTAKWQNKASARRGGF